MSKTTLKTRPWCPFCGQDVGRPQYPDKRKLGEFALGSCECGAVYASDPSGFNIGAAIVDCLVHACDDNWDLAWDLLPEEDYLTGRIEDYDEVTHQVVETRNLDGRIIRGVLYFIRLQTSVADLNTRFENKDKSGSTKPAISQQKIQVEETPDPKRKKKKANKNIVKELVENRDIDDLVALCFDDKKTLRLLQRQLYEPDEEKRWAVAKLIGDVCSRVSTRKPGMVSDMLHLLFEACSDSASSNWGAVETIGNIIAARPDIYGSFTRHLLAYIGDRSSMIQVLWALGAIAEKRPDLVRKTSFYQLIGLLDSPSVEVRGHMLRILGRLKAKEVAGKIKALEEDKTSLIIYENGLPVHTDIGTLAKEAMQLIEA
ncbi:MAG: HEAT repeat domain-containing protein [Deltaproteobacteria bacterium]|nr:MAG: HEAT repeat domain-containing protein [Deltaproteobacteria bacterium]